MADRLQNQRFRRTRGWIIQAFNELMFKRRYTDIRADDIIKHAGVGRSTFYEHFRNKDQLLRHSASHLLAVLADAVTDVGDVEQIRKVVEHIWEQQDQARALLDGRPGAALAQELATLIEDRLAIRDTAYHRALIVPVKLASRQVAEAQVALLRGWLEGGSPCSSVSLSAAVLRASRGLIDALEGPSNHAR